MSSGPKDWRDEEEVAHDATDANENQRAPYRLDVKA